MRGIYITEEAKKEIEAIIERLKEPAPHWDGLYVSDKMEARSELYEDILATATILPVEDWTKIVHHSTIRLLEISYPKGVIVTSNNTEIK